MNNKVFFIDNIYSKHFIASRIMQQYAMDSITNYHLHDKLSDNILFITSNLIGLTKDIINDFLIKETEQNILVGTLNNSACIIRLSDKLFSDIADKDLIFNNIPDEWVKHSLDLYPLKLLDSTNKIIAFEQEVQNQLRQKAIAKGVFLQDPASIYLAFDTKFGQGVVVEPHVYFHSKVEVHDNVHIKAFSYLEGVTIDNGACLGPFARIRGNSIIGSNARVGNFVEIKNSVLDIYTKVNHLSYIGDAKVGKNVNIGAGVVTCNYDGLKKYATIIKDDTFIGSNSVLIAPISIGSNSMIGASSFINQDVPDKTFAIGRSKQQMKINRRT